MAKKTIMATTVLKCALAILQKGGWCQDAFRKGDKVCAVQALSDAKKELQPLASEFRAAEERLDLALPKKERAGSVIGFNDLTNTTKRKIVELYRRAIARKQGR